LELSKKPKNSCASRTEAQNNTLLPQTVLEFSPRLYRRIALRTRVPGTRDDWLLHSRSGSPSGDLNFFLDNGLGVVLNPPPLGQWRKPEPLVDAELKPAIGVGRAFNHGILLGARMIPI
jgi:hypothetical protein